MIHLQGSGDKVLTALWTRKMSYEMQPCDRAGRPINGGNHYANADTIEGAREFAANVLRRDEFLGYRVWSVEITGRLMEFSGFAWAEVPAQDGGRREHETIKRTTPLPLTAADLKMTCYFTTILDYPETVHESRSDGSCKCGEHVATW